MENAVCLFKGRHVITACLSAGEVGGLKAIGAMVNWRAGMPFPLEAVAGWRLRDRMWACGELCKWVTFCLFSYF